MLAVILSLIISGAVFFLMKKEIDASATKQAEMNALLEQSIATRVSNDFKEGETRLTTEILNTIKPTVAEDMDKRLSAVTSKYDLRGELYAKYITSNVSEIKSIKSDISEHKSSNLIQYENIGALLDRMSSNIATVQSNIDLLDNKSLNYVDRSNIIGLINDQLGRLSMGGGGGGGGNDVVPGGSGNTETIDNVMNRLNTIEQSISSMDVNAVNAQLQQFSSTFANVSNFNQSIMNNSNAALESRLALNNFFGVQPGYDFVTSHKTNTTGRGFESWFDNYYNFGGTTRNFSTFKDIVDKTDNMFGRFSSNTDAIDAIRSNIKNIETAQNALSIGQDNGIVVNLGDVRNILTSNSDQIRAMQTVISDKIQMELSNMPGVQIAEKLNGTNVKVKSLTSEGDVIGSDFRGRNMRILGNLVVGSNVNVGDKLSFITDMLTNMGNTGGGVSEESGGRGGGFGMQLVYQTDNALAEKVGVTATDFVQQRSISLNGQHNINIPQKYIHSVSGTSGKLQFHEVDFTSQTSNIIEVEQNLMGVPGSALVDRIYGDNASFNDGIRLGSNGCIRLNEEQSEKPTLELCDRTCSTNCRKIWDYSSAPYPQNN